MGGSHPKGPRLKEAGGPGSALKCARWSVIMGWEMTDLYTKQDQPGRQLGRGSFAEGSSGWKTLMEREMGSSSKQNMGPRPAVLSLQ